MKILPITTNKTSNQFSAFKGHPQINGGGGIIPDSIIYGQANIDKPSILGKFLATATGKLVLGFAALVGIGSYIAHKIDKNLVQTGELDIDDIYNPERDRMYM